jgi:hypothetical protein
MPEKDAEKHLMPAPNRQLATTAIAAMAKRSLAELASLRGQTELPAIDWDQPVIIGRLVTGWLEGDAPEHGTGAKWVTLVCNLTNVSSTSQDLRGELFAFCCSPAWVSSDCPAGEGRVTNLTDVRLLAFPPENPAQWLRPQEETQVELEFVWAFSGPPPQRVLQIPRGAKRWDGFEDFVQGMFGGSFELLLYDKTFGTVVCIPNDEETYRELRLRLAPGHANEQYVICVECGTEYPPGAVKLLPAADVKYAMAVCEHAPDDEMFFCFGCGCYSPMSPPDKHGQQSP